VWFSRKQVDLADDYAKVFFCWMKHKMAKKTPLCPQIDLIENPNHVINVTCQKIFDFKTLARSFVYFYV